MTGLDHVAQTMPRRSARSCASPCCSPPPAAACSRSLWHRDRRTRLGLAAGLAAVAAFCVLAAAGLPIITRYVLLPAALLAIFAGAGVFGWRDLPPGPQRTWWARFGALALVVLVLFIPSQAARIDRLGDALQHARRRSRATSATSCATALRCEPVAVPNRRPIPLLALWLKLDPRAIEDAQSRRARARHVPRAAHAAGRERLHPRPARPRPRSAPAAAGISYR